MTVIHFWLIYSCLIFGTGILCDHKLERRQAGARCSKTSKNTFSCSDGQCIVRSSVCDGRKDCSDGSDESKEMCNRYEYGTSKIECGRVYNTSNSVSTTNDMKKLIGRAPWTVGIYKKEIRSSYYIYVCAGSIIGPKQIVSVASCIRESSYLPAKISIKDMFKVAIGKNLKSFHTKFETVDNEFTQIMDVESVYAHENVHDEDKQLEYNIAVVVLSKRITFSDYVKPVCIDWSGKYKVKNGTKGQVGLKYY